MELRLSSNSDLNNSSRLFKRSLNMRAMMLTSPPSLSITCLTGLRKNTRDSLDTNQNLELMCPMKNQSFLIPLTLLNLWTGEKWEPSLRLRTKDSADHAGLSPLLVPLKVHGKSLETS